MDGKNFDELTRKLASGTSRRNVLRGLVGGGAALVGMKAAGTSAAHKTTICHFPPGNPGNVQIITVGNPSLLPAHYAHGDSIYGDCCVDSDCPASKNDCGVLLGCEVDANNTTYCAYEGDDDLCSSACDAYSQCCEGVCNASFYCEAVGTPNESCDDGDLCTESDYCGANPDQCIAGAEKDCGDCGYCDGGMCYAGTCSDACDICTPDNSGKYYCLQSTDPCCGSTDPCCGSTDPCCGSTDPCCGSTDRCCGIECPKGQHCEGGSCVPDTKGCTSAKDCPGEGKCCCFNSSSQKGTCSDIKGCNNGTNLMCLAV